MINLLWKFIFASGFIFHLLNGQSHPDSIKDETGGEIHVISESEVLVSWKTPDNNTMVIVKLENKTSEGYVELQSHLVPANKKSFSIKNLDQYTTYRVTLYYNGSLISFMWQEFSLYIPKLKNLHISYVLDDSIKVEWHSLDIEWTVFYSVTFKDLSTSQITTVTSMTNSAVLENLRPSTEYEITVLAHTAFHQLISPVSETVTARTLPKEVQNDGPVSHCPQGDVFTYACPSTQLEDKGLVCIPTTWLCDQDPDCPDGEDEGTGVDEPCHQFPVEQCSDNDQFQCTDDTQLCIPKNWMCDGDLDCEDGSDENKTNCPHVQNLIPCTPNELQCSGSHSCIPLSKVCDKNFDCDSGEDEFRCSNNKCKDVNCSHCVELATEGAKCYCDEGSVWDPQLSNCTDLNECEYEKYCDQPSKCINSENGFTCDCVDGYKLDNTSSCIAINEPVNEEATILIANQWDQRQLTIKGENLNPNYLRVSVKLTALDFDHRKGKIYWISYDTTTGKSLLKSASAKSSDSDAETIPINNYLTSVESFARDWVRGNWYFADLRLKHVSMCSENGMYCRNIVTALAGPQSIALNPVQGHVYIADWNETISQILCCKTNGEDLKVLISSKIIRPLGLEIDLANRHLYWADMELNVVERIDLSGDHSTRRIIAIGQMVEYIYGISVFENYLYLSDRHEKQIIKIHRFNYSEPAVTMETLSRPGQIHVYHRVKQPGLTGDDPCLSADCDQICTIENNESVLNAKCSCSAGYKMVDNKCQADDTCDEFCSEDRPKCTGPTDTHYPNTCSLVLCPPDKTYCSATKVCLPTAWWCDQTVDCPSGDDEDFSCRYKECDITEYECASGKCIDMTDKCNGNDDCGPYDNSDEENCPDITCNAENMFQCLEAGGDCISKAFVCDSHEDCVNGSDEDPAMCFFEPIYPCNEDLEFKCRSGECIASSWECDSDPDCTDGSDEDDEHCKTKSQCKDLERPCDSGDRCIPEKWFCDGDPDCIDRSDESDKNCPDANYTCPHPRRKCEKKGIHVCLRLEQICDGNNDCDDATIDEGGLCDSQMCANSSCSSICYKAPEPPGFICDCPHEEKLDTDRLTCIPAVAADKLCEQWGICGQKCELDKSLPHGYRCTCLDGFFLEPDEFTCKPLESNPVYVVYSNRHELRRVDVAASNAISLRSGLRNTIALDFYYSNGEPVLFWTDVMEDKIYRGTMSGNSLINEEAIIRTGLATTEGVAVDWVAENIYWVESSLDQIEVAKVDGTKRTTLVAGNMTSPRAIVVDPREGSLFWTDWDGHNPRIEKCSMSGDGRLIIHEISPAEGGGWPNGLAVDYDFRRLYWIDARSESIHTVDYFGKDSRLILKGHKDMTHPFAMSLFGNHVYWTDWDTNSVVRANKFNGSNVQVVQKAITQPFDLQVIHPKRQPLMNNPCDDNNGGCSDLCLLSYNKTVGCRCPHRKRLDADGKTCVDDIKFLLFTKSHEIRGVDLIRAHFNVIPVITIPHVDNPTAIDYDINSNTLYWADKGLNVINKANITADPVVETLIDKGLNNVEGFAIDWMSENMYFSSYDLNAKTASISVATLNGTFRTELLNKDIVQPQSIALHPIKGFMYFVDVNGNKGNHKLFRAKMDGNEFIRLMEDLNEPTSLSLDIDDNRLYFINAGNQSIISCNLDGKDAKIFQSANITKPEALTVYRDLLYVAMEDQIVTIKKDGSGFSKLRDATSNVNALLLYDVAYRRKEPSNDCHHKPSKCSQLCLPTSKLISRCKCTAGFDIGGDDNTSCNGIQSFLLYAKETEIRGQKFDPLSTQEALPPISQIQSASAVDFLASEDTIFWVDTKANTISRIKRDLTKREVIIRDGINSVEGLAVDWISKNIYWTDAGHSTIEMAKINGSNRYVITSGDMEKPRSIVVNPVLGYLYWSDWGSESRIERARLDGSDRVQYVYNDIYMPWGLTIDYETHNLYWCDTAQDQQTIEAIDLMTGRRRILIKQSAAFPMSPISLTVFRDSIYWIDGKLNESSMYSASKADGSNRTLIRGDLGGSLKDVKAFDSIRQTGSNKCAENNGGCAELCFYIGNDQVKCACSFGQLDSDGKACKDYDGFLMFSKVTELVSIHLKDANDKNPPVESITSSTSLRNVIGLSFDYNKKLIFYSDIQRGDIQAVDFSGTTFRTVVEGIGSAEGLAYERINDDLYWTSYTNSCISRINVEDALSNKSKKGEVVVQLSKLDHPRAIVVDSCWELIYWTNWNNEQPRIQRSDLTGHHAEDVIVKDILTPNGLTIDHKAKMLYWSDARLDKIERCDMDGTNRHIIITSIPQHSFGLVIYDDYLFWTDWMLRAVIRANKYDGTEIIWLRKSLERQPMGIIAVAEDSENCEINKCHGDNFGCQDKCFTNERGEAFCQCKYGRLKADGKTCASHVSCANLNYEAFACLNGFCLPYQKSCDGVIDCVDGSDELPRTCADRSCPPTMFPCSNRTQGQCIALSKKCDGKVDCNDGSDELSMICGCPPQQFRCKKDGNCIPKEYRCDGNGDCHDNSDEVGCDAVTCQDGYWKCAFGASCIPEDHKCDGKFDCSDKSDESLDLCVSGTCAPEMFRCNNGECIHKNWKCDRDVDCTDHSDENVTECNYSCKETQFMCEKDSMCINKAWRCDGNPDCSDKSDEFNCTAQNCTGDKFQCNADKCIPTGWQCDGEPDCRDGKDEGPEAGCDPVVCEESEFECANYRCIEKEFYCDKDDDCGDASDEPETCDFSRICAVNEFECDDQACVDNKFECDGKPDCPDQSDEQGCVDHNCGQHNYTCNNGVCIGMELVCNSRDDCGDGSDESADCYIDECAVFIPCSQICESKKIGYQCKCNPGFQLREDGVSCEDIDECKTVFPCSHYCFNTIGSYYCMCADHYELDTDRRRCILTAQEGQPFLLVSNRYNIRKVGLNGSNEILVPNLIHSVAIDFDYQEKKLYWTDIHSQSSTINRISLNKSADEKNEVLHSSTVLNPDGMAVDWVGRNLYWCDRNTDTIEVSKLDGKYRKILLRDKTFLREPRALELFPRYGLLFLSDWGDKPHISRLSMDGKMKQHIITDEIAWPNALTIDYVTEKLFWADANYDYIAMSDLDGSNRHKVITDNLPHIFALTTFMDAIYWTDWETNGVFRAEKFSGEKRSNLVYMKHRPMDLVVYHSMRQPKMANNPCEVSNCSHLCLLRPAGDLSSTKQDAVAVCACPENHNIDANNRTCTAACDSSQFLCVTSSKCIPLWWQCDGHMDCEDGSDEDLNCREYKCRQPGLFQCDNATLPDDCIPPIGICDGTHDCADGSDETSWNNCSLYPCILHQFKCIADNKCISDIKKCDGKTDCSDGADEVDCAKQECLDNQFRCNTTGNCIPYLWHCDGDNDCGDWFDEKSCDNRTCRDDHLKCNKTKKCIPKAWECDGDYDCGTGDDTDEKQETCAERSCDETYFKCLNAHCIPGRWRCDDDQDCSDGSDEKDCPPRNCSDNEFKCTGGNKCIPRSSVCDGRHDCKDLSDEKDCPTAVQCSAMEFPCSSGSSCIPGTWKCDGEEDCLDGSDEKMCNSSCGKGFFRCKSGPCISMLWLCDGEKDCSDHSDEEKCNTVACATGRFRCGDHVCIPIHKKCNGVEDCSDGLDEKICNITNCPYGTYRCKNGRRCLKYHQLCDGKTDCEDDGDGDDGEDEDEAMCGKANIESCGIMGRLCKGSCEFLKGIKHSVCRCPTGYKLADDETSCILDDPCQKWGTCSQLCRTDVMNTSLNVTSQKVTCLCDEPSYKPISNTGQCSPEGYIPTLMIADEENMYEQKVTVVYNETVARIVPDNATKIVAIDVDVSSSNPDEWNIFLVKNNDSPGMSIMLKSYKPKDRTPQKKEKPGRNTREVSVTTKEETLLAGLNAPNGLAVDWIGKNLYWTDGGTSKIEMCQFDGMSCSRRKAVVKLETSEPFSIVVDPNYGKIFWTDRGYPPRIESAHLDGSNRTVLVRDFLIWPNGLAIDYPNGRLYWADTKSHTVETVTLEGTDRHIVKTFDVTDPPYMVDIFGDDLYVTTYKKNKVLKMHKFFDEKKDKITVLANSMMHIEDIVIIHGSKQMIKKQSVVNMCSTKPCADTQLCVNNPAATTNQRFTCLCADGAVFNNITKKCDFVQCPTDYCRNNGTCTVTQSNDFKCSCKMGFGGKKCEVDACLNHCMSGGTCHVTSDKPSSPTCACAPMFFGPRCEYANCTGYCLNDGICTYNDTLKTVVCKCLSGFMGAHCEQINPDAPGCAGYCMNGGTCHFTSDGKRNCTCAPEYTGPMCESCGLQGSTVYCANGGTLICYKTQANSPSTCKCLPGYDPNTNCMERTCAGYCENGAACTKIGNQLSCQCPAGYTGNRCQNFSDCKSIQCKNGGTCIQSNAIGPVHCACVTGFEGSYCENNIGCAEYCLNNGNCSLDHTGSPICTCPQFYKGPKCTECRCGNNGKCKTRVNGETYCECVDKHFEGPYCNRSICHDWCFNNGECMNCKLDPALPTGQCEECRCKPNTSGPRCHIFTPQHQETAKAGSIIPIIIPIVIVLCLLVAVLLFIIIRKRRNFQFRHSRLKDHPNLQVSNPIYMPQTTEDDEEEDESHQPLDQPYDFDPEKSTNFANPVYEQFYADSRQTLLPKKDDSEDESPTKPSKSQKPQNGSV